MYTHQTSYPVNTPAGRLATTPTRRPPLPHPRLAVAIPKPMPYCAERYAGLRDRLLAATLTTEDLAEEHGLNPLERISCRIHRRWAYQCASSPQHVIPMTGHRWCHPCESPAAIAVDELSGQVHVTCQRCRQRMNTRAARQIMRTCRQSLAASRAKHSPITAQGTPGWSRSGR